MVNTETHNWSSCLEKVAVECSTPNRTSFPFKAHGKLSWNWELEGMQDPEDGEQSCEMLLSGHGCAAAHMNS